MQPFYLNFVSTMNFHHIINIYLYTVQIVSTSFDAILIWLCYMVFGRLFLLISMIILIM